jgi:hypothetical protein
MLPASARIARTFADALRAAFGNPPYWESFRGLSGDESRAGTL